MRKSRNLRKHRSLPRKRIIRRNTARRYNGWRESLSFRGRRHFVGLCGISQSKFIRELV